jgi:hypothetical protein
LGDPLPTALAVCAARDDALELFSFFHPRQSA